jgi:hypothetical protein
VKPGSAYKTTLTSRLPDHIGQLGSMGAIRINTYFRNSSGSFAHPNTSSISIWWCTRARSRASATALWATRCRTAATDGRRDHHVMNWLTNIVIDWPMNMRDRMMLGRGRCRKGSAENDCDGKHNPFSQHLLSPASNEIGGPDPLTQDETAIPSSNKVDAPLRESVTIDICSWGPLGCGYEAPAIHLGN